MLDLSFIEMKTSFFQVLLLPTSARLKVSCCFTFTSDVNHETSAIEGWRIHNFADVMGRIQIKVKFYSVKDCSVFKLELVITIDDFTTWGVETRSDLFLTHTTFTLKVNIYSFLRLICFYDSIFSRCLLRTCLTLHVTFVSLIPIDPSDSLNLLMGFVTASIVTETMHV